MLATPSPYQQILEWSHATVNGVMASWPMWQRDALRRIVSANGPLNALDLDELEMLCKGTNGIGIPVMGIPLASAHLPIGPDATSSVSLVKIGSLKNVNRVTGIPPLEFGNSPGLSIIFGDNGAGKSGYARVIKKSCRARGVPPVIKPNAFDSKAKGPASADIEFNVAKIKTVVSWRDGAPSDPRLGNIFVFDSVSARAHVGEDASASFVPRGLDVLPLLAKACVDLKTRLKAEADRLLFQVGTIASSWKYKPTTSASSRLRFGIADRPPDRRRMAGVEQGGLDAQAACRSVVGGGAG